MNMTSLLLGTITVLILYEPIGAFTPSLTDKKQLKLHISVSLLLTTAKTIIAVNLKYFGFSFLANLTRDDCKNFAIDVVMVCHCYQFFSLIYRDTLNIGEGVRMSGLAWLSMPPKKYCRTLLPCCEVFQAILEKIPFYH